MEHLLALLLVSSPTLTVENNPPEERRGWWRCRNHTFVPLQRRARRLQGGDAAPEEAEREGDAQKGGGKACGQEEMTCCSATVNKDFPLWSNGGGAYAGSTGGLIRTLFSVFVQWVKIKITFPQTIVLNSCESDKPSPVLYLHAVREKEAAKRSSLPAWLSWKELEEALLQLRRWKQTFRHEGLKPSGPEPCCSITDHVHGSSS